MTAVNDILAELPVEQLAALLGADEQSVREAAGPAVTSLLGGLAQNAQQLDGAQSLAFALSEHADRGLLDGGISLDQIDPAEGDKIVQHAFGTRTDEVARALGSRTGAGNGLIDKLLPLLAPIVLGYLAKQLSGRGGMAGDILGQVLGGGAGQAQGQAPTQQGGNVLGGILYDVLGQAIGGAAAGQDGSGVQPSPSAPTSGSTPTPADQSGLQFPQPQAPRTESQPSSMGSDILGSVLGSILGKR